MIYTLWIRWLDRELPVQGAWTWDDGQQALEQLIRTLSDRLHLRVAARVEVPAQASAARLEARDPYAHPHLEGLEVEVALEALPVPPDLLADPDQAAQQILEAHEPNMLHAV